MAPVFTAIAGRENPGPAAAARGTGQAGIKIFKYWSLLISSMGQYRLGCLESGHFSVWARRGGRGAVVIWLGTFTIHNTHNGAWWRIILIFHILSGRRKKGWWGHGWGHMTSVTVVSPPPLLGSAQVRERPPLVSWSKINFTLYSCSVLTVPANFCRKWNFYIYFNKQRLRFV